MQIIGLVLAAGQGTRMKSKLCKVMHPLCGKPMIGHVINSLEELGTNRNVVIVGHGAQSVQDYVGERAHYALQSEQLGTGHAVMQAKSLLQDEDGILVLVYGDMPLIRASSLEKLISLHRDTGAAGTILTARMAEPEGYGRIVRSEQGDVTHIVEQKDCTAEQALIQEINTGAYCFDNRKLFAALEKVTNDNVQQEYYLTDVISILREQGEVIQAHCLEDYRESTGINDRLALAEAAQIMRQRIHTKHLYNGVSIIDPLHTYIDVDVTIGMDTVIYPGTHLSGATVIGEDCTIGPDCDIADSIIGNGVEIKHSVLRDTEVGDTSSVGPFAHLRPGTRLRSDVRVGDFVEIKNATIDEGSRVAHLSYIGDAKVGKNVNIGCGAITVNFDGFHKHATEIGDGAFIGSNVNLIAPIKIGKKAFVVAGSTITDDVKDDSFTIARARQTDKPDYAEKIRNRMKQKYEDS